MKLDKNTPDYKLKKTLRRNRRRKIHKIIRMWIFILLLCVGILGFIVYYPKYKRIKKEAYTKLSNITEDTFKRKGNTEIYDIDGNLIGKYGNEKYKYIPYEDISKYVVNGYIAKEDKNFLYHHGVDFKALVRVGYYYIKNKGEITQGGSTITQQVVKNNLLTQNRTIKRKATEMLLAMAIEKQYNKNQIMEFYCNSNYYGNGCYGIEAASQYYFGCSAKNLSLGNAAILVATSNLPNTYNPIANYELSINKRNEVLLEMLRVGYIDEDTYVNTIAEKPTLVQQRDSIIKETYMTTYALHCSTLELMKLNGFEFQYIFDSQDAYEDYIENYNTTYNNTSEMIRSGGYKIYTSLDPEIQNTLQACVDDNLAEFDERDSETGLFTLQGAAVCVNNSTNMVSAIVGGREGAGYYNRGYQAERQSGSAIKPLLDYGPAIDQGVVFPGTIIKDEEITIDGYTPLNANRKYIGDVSIRKALLLSINTIAVKLYTETGNAICMDYLNRMHFSSLSYTDTIIPAAAIGGFTNGVTVVDMAKGYATLANDGEYSENTCIIKIYDSDATLLCEKSNITERVYDSDTAFIISDMLEQTFMENAGVGKKYKTDDQIYAGKTGTTNDTKDVWFCGYSKYYTTAVWIGYDMPKEMTEIQSSTYPVKIWTEFMQEIHKNLPVQEFIPSETVKLQDKKGSIKEITYDKNIYQERPANCDYVSIRTMKKADARKKEQDEITAEKEAEEAVGEFEDFQIMSIEDTDKFIINYNQTYELVEKVSDNEKKQELYNRLSYKYDLLKGEVTDRWNDAIDAYNYNKQKQKDADNILKKQESIEKAEEERKYQYIELVKSYIEDFNDRTYYTSYMEDLIIDAEEALEQCSAYDEYDQLKEELQTAINNVRLLPDADSDIEE